MYTSCITVYTEMVIILQFLGLMHIAQFFQRIKSRIGYNLHKRIFQSGDDTIRTKHRHARQPVFILLQLPRHRQLCCAASGNQPFLQGRLYTGCGILGNALPLADYLTGGSTHQNGCHRSLTCTTQHCYIAQLLISYNMLCCTKLFLQLGG